MEALDHLRRLLVEACMPEELVGLVEEAATAAREAEELADLLEEENADLKRLHKLSLIDNDRLAQSLEASAAAALAMRRELDEESDEDDAFSPGATRAQRIFPEEAVLLPSHLRKLPPLVRRKDDDDDAGKTPPAYGTIRRICVQQQQSREE